MRKTGFNKADFIEKVADFVRFMYRKELAEASQQEIFQAVSGVVKDVIMDDLNDINNCHKWDDMSGKRIARPEKGLYIKNGKKVYYEGRRDN